MVTNLLEKLESFHSATGVGEQDSEVFFGYVLPSNMTEKWLVSPTTDTKIDKRQKELYSRDVWQMQRGRGRKDVLEVLGAGLFEAMQRRVREVFGETLVVQTVPG